MNDFSTKNGVQVFDVIPILDAEIPDNRYSKTSVAYFHSDGSSGYPQITITQPGVYISWRVAGGGMMRHTWLDGSPTGTGGSYYLNQGEGQVAPGTYYHNLDGVIVNTGNGGSIESTIRYN